MRKQGQHFETMGETEKEVLKENNARIKEINKEIERLFINKLDTAGFLRKELNKERKLLQTQNNGLRKGLIKIGNRNLQCKCGRLFLNNECLICDKEK